MIIAAMIPVAIQKALKTCPLLQKEHLSVTLHNIYIFQCLTTKQEKNVIKHKYYRAIEKELRIIDFEYH